MNTTPVSTLVKLGLMDPLDSIRTIIDAIDPADLSDLESQVSSMIEERREKILKRVKRTRLKGLEAWHLSCGDREIIAKIGCPRHQWRVYEVRRTRAGDYKKGPMLQTTTAVSCLTIAWKLAIGQL